MTPHRVDCRADGGDGTLDEERRNLGLPYLLLHALMALLVWRNDCLHLHLPILNTSLFSKKESQQLAQEILYLMEY